MRMTLVLMLTGAATVAYAQPASSIAAKAATCWDLPLGTADMQPAVFDIVVNDDGRIRDATVINYSEDQPRARLFVTSALRALMLCSPYEILGEHQIVMDPAQIPERGINPFK